MLLVKYILVNVSRIYFLVYMWFYDFIYKIKIKGYIRVLIYICVNNDWIVRNKLVVVCDKKINVWCI